MMQQQQQNQADQERRQYIRLDSVLPVQFRVFCGDKKEDSPDWLQGFTSDISKGGICLAINNPSRQLLELVSDPQTVLDLIIEIPLIKTPVTASGRVAWVKEMPGPGRKCLIGLIYENIDERQNDRIMRYAITKKAIFPSSVAAIILLGLFLGVNSYMNMRLLKGNKMLVKQLVTILQESVMAKQKIGDISKEKQDLQLKMQALQVRMDSLEAERRKESEEKRKAEKLTAALNSLTKEKNELQTQLIALQHKENKVTEELLQLDKRRTEVEKANFDKIYHWLTVHQNPRTGLVMSFEGDDSLKDWAFIYDQSLAMQAYLLFSDTERARNMLDFFAKKAKRGDGLFYNAYYADDGSPAEYVVHCGPNIWLGIAALHYTDRTGDKAYLPLAEDIYAGVMRLQGDDGGLRGGPEVEWFSTEHNLDAYSFCNMLYKMTGDAEYLVGRDKILNWLVVNTYNRSDIPINRGKGDSTIATDTYAWAVAAVGPAQLEAVGMNPDKIMEFAEEHCAVEAEYVKQDNRTVKIKGFDFSAAEHLARGGVVSSEWTAQMILAFRIMADFYSAKGIESKVQMYEAKADEYLNGLVNLIVSSPSPSGQGQSCLPYATQDSVDTGHGWISPKGKRTGSVSGTAYTLFAYYRYNPLEIK
ncbi:MAG: hypothetical protein GX598_00330 [Elusimicrobia bacterium]|nr:hypothetical protein [Elusimicrobiota bacterium]